MSARPSTVSANYQYWRDQGPKWVEDYDRHKKAGPKYHIGEFVLCDYVERMAPARVLEFGCGSGRHLRYLCRVPGVRAHGFDQSPTMVDGMLRWTSREWVDEHVQIGEPLQRLPYGDGEFDLVFTASVLVHVRPEDLEGRLSELARVSRGHVLHLEPRPDRSHSGQEGTNCWRHDLVAAYQRLGWTCEDLGAQTRSVPTYRALKPGTEVGWRPSPRLLELYDRLVSDLSPKA